MNDFSELTLSSTVKSNLTRNGFVQPTPVQAQSLPPALAGRDVIATAQTGTGKTLAFVVPIIEALLKQSQSSGVHAVVLTPTRELAIQIHETFAKLAANTGIRAAVVVGGMSEKTQLRQIRAGARVLIATPGRLVDYLDRKLVNLGGVRTLVLDEADRMLDMGFLPVIRRILREIPTTRQTMFFSATIERSVAHLINDYLVNPVRVALDSPTRVCDNVELHLYSVEQVRKLELLRYLIENNQGSFLVFARTKHGTDRLAKSLAGVGIKASRIHGDRTQHQRNDALRGFQQGECRVLVATDVAARGIHVDGIAHVVNYDLPQAPEDFIHRVGRTARAGAVGTASTFAMSGEQGEVRGIEKLLGMRLKRCDLPAEVRGAVISKVVVIPTGAGPRRPWQKRRAIR